MRKKFFVKPALQLKHLVWTLLAVLACFVSCYLVFESILTSAISRGSLDMSQWIALRESLRLGFGITLLLLLAAIGTENYLFFHSVAGPLYALEKGLRRLAKGDFGDVVQIRETDELGDLIQTFETMKKQIQTRIDLQEKTAQFLSAELDRVLANVSPDNIGALKLKLKEIKDQMEKKAA